MFKKVILFVFLIVMVACKKGEPQQLDSLAAEGIVNTSFTDFTLINTPGNFKILPNQGTKGVIVFNTGIPNIPFRAFDLSCPYISPLDCVKAMVVDSSGTMSCKECIEDSITFTSISTTTIANIDGEDRTLGLIEYRATLQGNTIRISNFRR